MNGCNESRPVAEAEAERDRLCVELAVTVSPLWLERWNSFKAQLVDGDELWYWEHFPGPMTGGTGYCIIRDGRSIACVATTRA